MTLAQRAYVASMMQVVARGLAAASRIDPVLRQELSGLPTAYRIAMRVWPAGPVLVLLTTEDGSLRRVQDTARPNLDIRFKHLAHAFLVLSFQEGTARAFANDRMVADGDVAHATRLVRCLNRMESVILPGFVARRAVKRVDAMPAFRRGALALRIYAGMAFDLVRMR